jgi:hypothetical protein
VPASPRERTIRFFGPLLARNPSGLDFLPPLLRATPGSAQRLGELVEDPSWLHANLTVPGLEGRRPCFHYPVAPPPALVEWFIDHPHRLRWPNGAELSTEALLLRQALLCDEPAGARAKAQERARELIPIRSAFAREWWRFEETFEPDCVLITDRLVLTFVAAEHAVDPVSGWYRERTVLVRALEAAERLAAPDDRAWGTVLLAPRGLADGTPEALSESLPAGAPHRDAGKRSALAAGYLGQLTWEAAEAAVAPVLPPRR